MQAKDLIQTSAVPRLSLRERTSTKEFCYGEICGCKGQREMNYIECIDPFGRRLRTSKLQDANGKAWVIFLP
jgi:hypothetical protein